MSELDDLLARVAELEAEADELQALYGGSYQARREAEARVRVQAEQIAALQEEANEFVAMMRASVDACSLRLRAALALAEGCAAPADEEEK